MNRKFTKKLMAYCTAMLFMQSVLVFPQTFAQNADDLNDDPGKFRRTSEQTIMYGSADKTESETDTDETNETDTTEETDTEGNDTEVIVPTVPTCMEDLTHNARYMEDYFMIDGIDVSKYQKQIDWEAVAEDGIEYVIIRLGYRGYGTAGNMRVDDYFAANLEGAKAAGLDVGVYFFTQAITEEEAVEEANFVLNALQGAELDLPVYFDIESITYDTGRLDSADLTAEEHTANCEAFCETIEAAGYDAGIYANTYWLTELLDTEYLEEKYPIWFANYRFETPYEGDYHMWQYTSSAEIAGIEGYVDRNVLYSRMVSFAEEEITLDAMETIALDFVGDGNLTFVSSDPDVAAVDENGFLTPVKNGTTTIEAVSDNGSSDVMTVTVSVHPDIILSHSMLHFTEIGTSKQLVASGTENKIFWASEDESIATVTSNGVVKAVGSGTVNIVAKDMFGKKSVCSVLVTEDTTEIGDCNADGVIDATDAATVLTFSATNGVNSDLNVPETLASIYDTNMDGVIDALDASSILILSAASGTVK